MPKGIEGLDYGDAIVEKEKNGNEKHHKDRIQDLTINCQGDSLGMGSEVRRKAGWRQQRKEKGRHGGEEIPESQVWGDSGNFTRNNLVMWMTRINCDLFYTSMPVRYMFTFVYLNVHLSKKAKQKGETYIYSLQW